MRLSRYVRTAPVAAFVAAVFFLFPHPGFCNGYVPIPFTFPSISSDGRYVAFNSMASTLVAGDTNGTMDVFLYDRDTGEVTLVSSGSVANGTSFFPSVSSDGRYVAFTSGASNLVSDDTNDAFDIFLYDRDTGETTLVSRTPEGDPGNNHSNFCSISPDGRYVAFTSEASDLVDGDDIASFDVFLLDRDAGQITLVSKTQGGDPANDHSNFRPSVSSDGRYVAFTSHASNLVSGDTNDTYDVFLCDRNTGEVTLVSRGSVANGPSLSPAISEDGRYVAFSSIASNLVDGDTNGPVLDVFLYDRLTSKTKLVSKNPEGESGDHSSGFGMETVGGVSISPDGRYVAFDSFASNLVDGDTYWFSDVFLYDQYTDETTLVSTTSAGVSGNMWSNLPSVSSSSEGLFVAFGSFATDLVAERLAPGRDPEALDRISGRAAALPQEEGVDYVYVYEVPLPSGDTDGDGASDYTESAQSNYDGNVDGVPDYQQNWVVSFTTWDSWGSPHYITLECMGPWNESNHSFLNPYAERTFDSPSPWGVFPYGYFRFQVHGLRTGGSTTVTVRPDGNPPSGYYQYGKTPDNPVDHWYEFLYDGETGAEVVGNTIVLHFVDGKRGDNDITENGIIKDPGGPYTKEVRETLFFPYIIRGSGEETELGIISKENYEVTAVINYYEADGSFIIGNELILPGLAKETLQPSMIPFLAGSAIVSSNGELAGYSRYANSDGQRCAWPAGTGPVSFLSVPHVVTGGEWRTGLSVFNPGDEKTTVTLTSDSTTPGTLELDPYEREFFWLSGSEDITRLVTTGNMVVMEVLESLAQGGDRAALLLKGGSLTELTIPRIPFAGGSWTGIGLKNVFIDGDFSLFGHDAAGTITEVPMGSIAGGSRTAFYANLLLGTDNVWAHIAGETGITTPIGGTNPLSLQGLAIYGEDDMAKLGSVKLNGLKFYDGILGVVSAGTEPSFALVNPGDDDATVVAAAYQADGVLVADHGFDLAAGENLTGVLSDLLDGASLASAAYIRIISDVYIYGFETIYEGERMEMLPVLNSE